MKRTVLVAVLVVALTFAFAASAFADHSPDFYVQWNAAGANAGTDGSPHSGYTVTTVKCAVCHAVHRAAVPGQAGMDAAWGGSATTPGTAAGSSTQLLLRSSVAEACNYCHISTAIGGVRIYNGNVSNVGNWVNSGYGHGNGCTDCHAVHGANTFGGAMSAKILRWDQYKGGGMLTGAAPLGGSEIPAQPAGAEHSFVNPATGNTQASTMQDEIFIAGSASGYVTGNSARVAADNVPMFLDPAGTPLSAVNGTNLNTAAGYTNAHEAQGSAFCTQCHMNFSNRSETVVNIDNEMALFQGWAAGTNGGLTPYGSWASASDIYTSKNHPMRPLTTSWAGHGGTTSATQVAWEDATYCRSCHDAGEVMATENRPAGYVVENSYPHATPGYLDFMTAATNAVASYPVNMIGAAVTGNRATGAAGNKDSYADNVQAATPVSFANQSGVTMPTDRWTITLPADVAGIQNYGSFYSNGGTTKVWNDGSCLKCHVNGTQSEGVGKTF